jgi:hypothetical protein
VPPKLQVASASGGAPAQVDADVRVRAHRQIDRAFLVERNRHRVER